MFCHEYDDDDPRLEEVLNRPIFIYPRPSASNLFSLQQRSTAASTNSIRTSFFQTGSTSKGQPEGHDFYWIHEMDSVNESNDYMPASGAKGSRYKVNNIQEVISPKRTKVLLIVLGFSLVFALGGLCALGTRYNHKLGDFESLNEQHIVVSKQLAAQEINSTALKKEFNDLTSRYNTLREWLSFYDAQSCNLSADGWIACRGKLYLFSSDKLNWSSSRDVCVSKGADLVTITSRSEQDFLVSKMKVTHWIGLNDLDTEGRWVWVNNQTLNDTGVQFWFIGTPRQPDNWRVRDPSGENCASLGDHYGNFQSWFDASCETEKKFICEKKY